MQALEGSKSLEEVTAAHSRFVVAVQRQCLLAPDKTWKLIEGVVVQILNQVLHFADLQQKLRKPVRECVCVHARLCLCMVVCMSEIASMCLCLSLFVRKCVHCA
jgi:hypothetical protein